jgi:hypothetical protein
MAAFTWAGRCHDATAALWRSQLRRAREDEERERRKRDDKRKRKKDDHAEDA